MPRVLQVLANPNIGGTETFAINLSLKLSEAGIGNQILNLASDETPFSIRCLSHGVSPRTLGNSSSSYFDFRRAISAAVREFEPEIVLSFGLRVSLLLRFFLPRHLRPRHITGLRGLDTWRRPYHTLIDSLTESRVAYFVGVSKAVLEQRRTREKTPVRKLIYIPNAIDTSHFHPSSIPLPTRASLGLHEGRVFLTIANFREEKGHPFLLEAISRVRNLPDDVQFAWVGGGPEFEQMARLVAKSPVASKIKLLPAVGDVREYLGHASLFILPSREEGMPRALMEAVSMSIPVLATRVGGVSELFEHEKPGFVVDYGNIMDMASCIQTFCDAPGLASSFAANARQVILRNFDLRSITERYINLFKLIAEEDTEGIESFRHSTT
jgi:glycosyltransferase involved in cell wall biosynthesis